MTYRTFPSHNCRLDLVAAIFLQAYKDASQIKSKRLRNDARAFFASPGAIELARLIEIEKVLEKITSPPQSH